MWWLDKEKGEVLGRLGKVARHSSPPGDPRILGEGRAKALTSCALALGGS